MGAATAIIEVKEILFDGMKIRLASGEVVWIERGRIEDYLPHALVVPEWYKNKVMDKLHDDGKEGN